MENAIADNRDYFPIRQLNTILRGIKPNTEYNFFFKINDAEYENNFEKIIPQLKDIETNVIKSIKIIYNKIISEFREYYKNKNFLIIDINEESEKVSEYFKSHPEINPDELFNEGVSEFMDFLQTLPPAEELNESIKTNADKQSSIFVFQYGDDENDNTRGLYFPDVPESYRRVNVNFFFGENLIDTITEYQENKINCEYGTLHFLEKEKNFFKKLETKEFRLLKNINIEVNKPEERKDFEEQYIRITYSFNLRYDVKSFEII